MFTGHVPCLLLSPLNLSHFSKAVAICSITHTLLCFIVGRGRMMYLTVHSLCILAVSQLAFASVSCSADSCGSASMSQAQTLIQRKSSTMRHDDVDVSEAAIPRHELWNYVVPVTSSFYYGDPSHKHANDANKCQSNTVDGRIYFCGVVHRFVRYFKYETLSFTTEGLPIFNDDAWSQWPEKLNVGSRGPHASLCFPNWKKPFEVLEDGSHFYSMYIMSDMNRQWLNVTVSHPMTPQAEIVEVKVGDWEAFNREMPKYLFLSADGRLWIGKDQISHETQLRGRLLYSALPENAEACGLNWPEPRPLHEMPKDPDALNLPGRYPVARHPYRNSLGEAFSDELPIYGSYLWLDPDARNIWITSSAGYRVIGEDTSGVEYLLDSPLNSAPVDDPTGTGNGKIYRCMSSPLWNFESERTKAHRFPGELHTSGVGSGSRYQLPMSKGHHVMPTFNAIAQTYSEPELFNVWKSQHWDIIFLPMTASYVSSAFGSMPSAEALEKHKTHTPDLSRHFLHGKMLGDATVQWNATMDLPTQVQGVGHSMRFGAKGAVVVDLAASSGVLGVTSPVKGFTAQLSFKTFWPGGAGFRWLLGHPDLELKFGKGVVEWVFKGKIVLRLQVEAHIISQLSLAFGYIFSFNWMILHCTWLYYGEVFFLGIIFLFWELFFFACAFAFAFAAFAFAFAAGAFAFAATFAFASAFAFAAFAFAFAFASAAFCSFSVFLLLYCIGLSFCFYIYFAVVAAQLRLVSLWPL